ncbi:chemotaxis protein CheW [Halotalea alkalilenta]|uniref:chemotaxis protein CheW n=1 Tax=Halotalea alkalilenta TaxID=376489 RepID=UPI000694C57D|nr:chemotaxis protein CheW [Halotalea alkalilenta]
MSDAGSEQLFLSFSLDRERCLLEACAVVEVLAQDTPLDRLPGAPPWLLGTFSHRGRLVPVIDVADHLLGRASHPRRDTRLVVVEPQDVPVALMLEGVSGLIRLDTSCCHELASVAITGALSGRVIDAEAGLLHWLEPHCLLPAAIAAGIAEGAAR